MDVVRLLAFLVVLSSLMAAEPAFEVATVKPAARGNGQPIGWFSYPGGRLNISNCSLTMMIRLAYGVEDFQVEGGSPWVREQIYTVAAKAPEGSAASKGVPKSSNEHPSPEMLAMVRILLAERFQLKMHTETREGEGWALVAAGKGPKLTPTRDSGAFSTVGSGPTGKPDRPLYRRGYNASMGQFATALVAHFARPVLDQTGIDGNFDFVVEYANDDANPDAGASLFTALQEQLGLKLIPAKAPVEHLVIDRTERPSEN